jgi:type II secretory pathway component PulM
MREWWNNLGLREKQWVIVGTLIVILFLLYEILLAPLIGLNDSLRTDIQHNQKLSSWMQETNQHIQLAESMSQKNSSTRSSAGLLSLLQKEINQSAFASNMQQISQAENNSVQITFLKINFDDLIKWLTILWQKYNLSVSQINVTPNGALGMVDTSVVVS